MSDVMNRRVRYRGAPLIRKRTPLEPYRWPVPRVLGGVLREKAFSYGRGVPVVPLCVYIPPVSSACSPQKPAAAGHEDLSETMYVLISLRKSTPLLGESLRGGEF